MVWKGRILLIFSFHLIWGKEKDEKSKLIFLQDFHWFRFFKKEIFKFMFLFSFYSRQVAMETFSSSTSMVYEQSWLTSLLTHLDVVNFNYEFRCQLKLPPVWTQNKFAREHTQIILNFNIENRLNQRVFHFSSIGHQSCHVPVVDDCKFSNG